MAARTSSQAGAWSDSATWGGSAAPGIGDTATIGHAVTVDANTTFGTSGASGTNILTINGTGGSLTVNAGVTLNCRGGFTLNNATLTLAAGSTFTFDASAASAGSKYVGIIGTGHNQASAKVVCNGTSGNRVTIQSNTSGSHGWFNDGSGPWLQGGKFDADYTDFIRIGDSSNPAIRHSPSGDAYFELNYCTFDTNSGKLSMTYSIGNDATYLLTNNSFKQTAPASDIARIDSYGAKTSGSRILSGNWFEKQILLYSPVSFEISDNQFNGGIGVTTTGPWASASDNLVFVTGNDFPAFGDIDGAYIIATGSDNPHYIVPPESGNYGATISEVIFDCPGATNPTDHGDGVLMPGSTVSTTFTVQKCIMVPSSSGQTGGCIFSMQGNSNTFVNAYHNTHYHTTNAGIDNTFYPQLATVGETYNCAADQIKNFKSNLMAASVSRNGYLYANINGSPNNNTVLYGNATHNNAYNISAGSAGKGYNAPFTGGSPGANDLAVDPQFVDPTRNCLKYSLYKGGAGTLNDLREQFRSKNASYSVAEMIAYVQEGFKVQNILLKDAGHDGVTIGAMDYQAAAASGSTAKNRLLLGVG